MGKKKQEKTFLSLSKKEIREKKVLLKLLQKEMICPKVTLIFFSVPFLFQMSLRNRKPYKAKPLWSIGK